MSSVSNVSTGSSASAAPKPSLLTATDFLQILISEFQHQDPTSPSDPTQFATQLVDFANLGQLENIDSAVQQPASAGLMQAAGAYIGREVVTPGSQIGVLNGKSTSITWTAPSGDSYTAEVLDSAGQPVDRVTLGAQNNGAVNTFTWNPPRGTADGSYTVSIVNSKGVAVSGTLEAGIVQKVALTSAGVALDLGNLQIAENQVESVAQAQSSN